jgi:hypothetical protein
VSVDFSGVTGTIDYAGIEPGTPLAVGAGYQMNVTVPSGTSSGLNYLDIGGLDSYNGEALICVTSCADSSLRSGVRGRVKQPFIKPAEGGTPQSLEVVPH